MKLTRFLLVSCFLFSQFLLADTIVKPPRNSTADSYFAYWGGYFPKVTANPLEKTPKYIDVLALAFACPINDSLTLDFLCSQYTEDFLMSKVKVLQARGTKVVISLLDTPQTNWNNIDIHAFAHNVKNVFIDEWGLDGVDIDGESSMVDTDFAPSFIELVTEVRKAIGPKKLLSYTCYTGAEEDGQILQATSQYLDSINLMAYGDDMQDMESLFATYAQWIAPEKIRIGVKAGVTPVQEVASLTQWQPANTTKAGMMLWTFSQDTKAVTGQPNGTWTRTIEHNLVKQKLKVL